MTRGEKLLMAFIFFGLIILTSAWVRHAVVPSASPTEQQDLLSEINKARKLNGVDTLVRETTSVAMAESRRRCLSLHNKQEPWQDGELTADCRTSEEAVAVWLQSPMRRVLLDPKYTRAATHQHADVNQVTWWYVRLR